MSVPFASLALLQAAAPRTGGEWLFPVEIVLIVGVFYFMMVRPQQKQRKQHESTLMTLKKGDDIVTAGGIIGRIVHIKEATKDGAPAPTLADAITIQSGESRLIVERGRIARAGTTTTAAPGV